MGQVGSFSLVSKAARFARLLVMVARRKGMKIKLPLTRPQTGARTWNTKGPFGCKISPLLWHPSPRFTGKAGPLFMPSWPVILDLSVLSIRALRPSNQLALARCLHRQLSAADDTECRWSGRVEVGIKLIIIVATGTLFILAANYAHPSERRPKLRLSERSNFARSSNNLEGWPN